MRKNAMQRRMVTILVGALMLFTALSTYADEIPTHSELRKVLQAGQTHDLSITNQLVTKWSFLPSDWAT
jgi:hypothetical protein